MEKGSAPPVGISTLMLQLTRGDFQLDAANLSILTNELLTFGLNL